MYYLEVSEETCITLSKFFSLSDFVDLNIPRTKIKENKHLESLNTFQTF